MSDGAYVYRAALWCEDCGEGIKRDLASGGKAPDHPDDESSYDLDDYPEGPYPDGGGEADMPQHCDGCGTFLENPLTGEGVQYVREAIREALVHQARSARPVESVALTEWAPYYDIDLPREWSSMSMQERVDYIRANPDEFYFRSFDQLRASIRGEYLPGRRAI